MAGAALAEDALTGSSVAGQTSERDGRTGGRGRSNGGFSGRSFSSRSFGGRGFCSGGLSGWSLSLCLSGGPLLRKCYVFETSPMCTPSGNHVTLLSRVSVDGTDVPACFVVQMFRQLRESFQEE